jgi:tetratricopeptide (TPR) repeat protein
MNPSAQLQLVVSLIRQGNLDLAMAEATRMTDNVIAAEAWRALGLANANLQRFDAALLAIENASHRQPKSRFLRLDRAHILEQQGRLEESLSEVDALAREARDSPQLALQLGRLLHYTGQPERAAAEVAGALDVWPLDIPLHKLHAELQWSGGAGDEITNRLEACIARYPRELSLRLVAADLLRQAGFPARALALLEPARSIQPDSPAVLTSLGVLLDDLDRPGEALPLMRAAIARAPHASGARTNLAATLLRTGDAGEALGHIDALLALAPDDQRLIAYRATALRLLGDPAYGELHDYSRLVREYRLVPPPAFGDIREFNEAFARELRELHVNSRRPLAQSLRGGSQTDRNLPTSRPVIADFLGMLDAPVRDYIAALRAGDTTHPTDRRRGTSYRISGTWSVELSPGGYHVNHVHPQGWLSSAYYIEMPAGSSPWDERDAERAGWLKFGEPGLPIASCPPDHFVRPDPGLLVLFPSYLWHGTVPFTKGGRRLTAAFDVLPG